MSDKLHSCRFYVDGDGRDCMEATTADGQRLRFIDITPCEPPDPQLPGAHDVAESLVWSDAAGWVPYVQPVPMAGTYTLSTDGELLSAPTVDLQLVSTNYDASRCRSCGEPIGAQLYLIPQGDGGGAACSVPCLYNAVRR